MKHIVKSTKYMKRILVDYYSPIFKKTVFFVNFRYDRAE